MGNPSHFLPSYFTEGNRKSEISKGNEKYARIQHPPALPEEIYRQFSLTEIKAATNNFHPKSLIGKYGFGKVYKGIIDDGNLVAIKRYSPLTALGLDEYRTEVQLLCQLRHEHLVSLLGFYNDKEEMLLVSKLMINGALLHHLYGSEYNPLPWKHRLKICTGVARGLHYLHTGVKQAVIHCDVNSGNILLDDKWVGKLTGSHYPRCVHNLHILARQKLRKKINSRLVGTASYVDPKYNRGCELSEKCDVYSFGVVLFEVLCARPVVEPTLDEDEKFLVHWVRWCIGEGTIYNIIDPYLMGRIAPGCFKKFVDIAYCCTSEKGDTRPDMGEVELMLELVLEMQEKADSELVDVDPHGKCMYEEVSFSIPVSDHSL